MAARVVDLYIETFIGTREQWSGFVQAVAGGGAADVKLMINNVLLLNREVDADTIARALETRPDHARTWTVT